MNPGTDFTKTVFEFRNGSTDPPWQEMLYVAVCEGCTIAEPTVGMGRISLSASLLTMHWDELAKFHSSCRGSPGFKAFGPGEEPSRMVGSSWIFVAAPNGTWTMSAGMKLSVKTLPLLPPERMRVAVGWVFDCMNGDDVPVVVPAEIRVEVSVAQCGALSHPLKPIRPLTECWPVGQRRGAKVGQA